DQLKQAIGLIDPDLLTRPYYAGNQGNDPAAVRDWDAENGFAAQAKGKVTVSDDNGDTHIFTADGAGTYGTLSLDPSTGEWTYTLDNSSPDVQALAKGQVATDTFTVTITDQHGASTQTSVNVTVNGANDAPHDIELSGVVF